MREPTARSTQGSEDELEPVVEGLVGMVDTGLAVDVDDRAGGRREPPVPGDVISVVVGLAEDQRVRRGRVARAGNRVATGSSLDWNP
ncbi:MAG: hypothetical protein ACR2LY_02920 [Thermoleophilaceae bacterium]